jgi:DNA-binding transcriptional ArsR family regulator
MENNHPVLDGLFQALSDPTRRAVINRLGQGPATVTELAAPFPMALPSFLKHVRQLESAGWIFTRKEGRTRVCRIAPAAMVATESWLARQRAIWEARAHQLDRLVTSDHGESQ